MNKNKELMSLAESLTGLIVCQNLLLQYLIKANVVNKNDFSNAIDLLIDKFNRENPSQVATLTMKYIKDSLGKDFPDHPPPRWLRAIINGGRKEKP